MSDVLERDEPKVKPVSAVGGWSEQEYAMLRDL